MTFHNSTKFSVFFALPLLFAGCGDIQIPESIPTPTPVIIAEKTPEATPTPSEKPENSCTALQEERDSLSEAITISQEELNTCRIEKEQLQSLSANAQNSSNQITQLSPILSKYLQDIPQEEYKFDACGNLSIARNEAWYNDFKASLDNSTLFFTDADRQLEDTDFYSVCISNEGKSALFLGASSGGKSEFHMVKYNYEQKQLAEAVLVNGNCDLCPNKFGKRFGPYITLNGSYGGTNKVFQYYYDSNLIKEQ